MKLRPEDRAFVATVIAVLLVLAVLTLILALHFRGTF